MLLAHYIKREGCGYAGFGARFTPAISKGDVWNLAHGVRRVSLQRAEYVLQATNGEVSLTDLMAPFKDNFVMPDFVAANDVSPSLEAEAR